MQCHTCGAAGAILSYCIAHTNGSQTVTKKASAEARALAEKNARRPQSQPTELLLVEWDKVVPILSGNVEVDDLSVILLAQQSAHDLSIASKV